MAERIVDSHTHAWTTPEELPWETDGPQGAERIVYTAENVREDMDAMGVDRACLVATPIHGTGSPYTRACLERYPDEFYGVLWLDYFADDVAERVAEALELDGVLGFRFYATGDGDWMTSDGLDPFWEALSGYESPQVQILTDATLLEDVETVVADHPGVTFVIDHIGQPTPGVHAPDEPPYDAMADVAGHSNAHVKVTHTSSEDVYPFEDLHPYLRYLLAQFGSDRLLWGSDFVYHFKQATPWETLHFLDEAPFLSASDRRDLLYRTFESLAR
ncbi:MAG: amidohydrolase [Halobacteriaceae archaeon]